MGNAKEEVAACTGDCEHEWGCGDMRDYRAAGERERWERVVRKHLTEPDIGPDGKSWGRRAVPSVQSILDELLSSGDKR